LLPGQELHRRSGSIQRTTFEDKIHQEGLAAVLALVRQQEVVLEEHIVRGEPWHFGLLGWIPCQSIVETLERVLLNENTKHPCYSKEKSGEKESPVRSNWPGGVDQRLGD